MVLPAEVAPAETVDAEKDAEGGAAWLRERHAERGAHLANLEERL